MVVIPVVPKLNSLLTGRPVKFAPLTAGRVAGNVALGNVPVNCPAGKLVKFAPLPLKDVAVTTPVNLPSPPTSKAEDGSVDPIPTFPPEFCETPPVPD